METAQRAGTAGGAQLQHKLPRMSASNGADGGGGVKIITAGQSYLSLRELVPP